MELTSSADEGCVIRLKDLEKSSKWTLSWDYYSHNDVEGQELKWD